MNYFSEFRDGGYIYTVDMIRLRVYVSRTVYKEFIKQLHTYNLTYWEGKGGYGKFFDNFKVDKLWIGCTDHVSKKQKQQTWNDKINITIEFNPNKLTDTDIYILIPLLMHFSWTVIRFDLAIDIPKNINDLCLNNITKRSYSMFAKDFNDKTYYFGKGDGHIKIYNKKIESNLDYELTRYEITKCCEFDLCEVDIPYIKFKFVQIYFCPYYSDWEGDTYDCIKFAVSNGFPYRALSRDFRDKIKKDYLGSSELSEDAANHALICCLQKLRRLI